MPRPTMVSEHPTSMIFLAVFAAGQFPVRLAWPPGANYRARDMTAKPDSQIKFLAFPRGIAAATLRVIAVIAAQEDC